MQARGRRRDRALLAREHGLVVGAVLLVGRALARRYRAAAACRRARRSPGRAPARETQTTASPRRPRLCASTVASSWPRKQTRPSSPKRIGRRPRASWPAATKARQREPSSRLCQRRLDAAARSPRPMRRPVSRAGITRVSLTTSASPGCSRSGRSRDAAVVELGAARPAPPAAARHRAARRPQRDALRRQVEVEEIGAHEFFSPRPRLTARGSRVRGIRTRNEAPHPARMRVATSPANAESVRIARRRAIVALTILSGSLTGSPRLILSTFSMPSIDLAPDGVLVVEEARRRRSR